MLRSPLKKQDPKNRLARRLAVYVILFSSLVTVVTTAVQLYTNYEREVKHIETAFRSLETSLLPSLVHSVWAVDAAQIQTQINGFSNLPDVEFVVVEAEQIATWSAGKIRSKRFISQTFPLVFSYEDRNIELGTLRVVASLDDVFARLLQQLGIILLGNAAKTFLVAGFILLVFHRLIAQHLYKISVFLRDLDMSTSGARLQLDRKALSGVSPDEFDDVVAAINAMQDTSIETFSALRESEQRFRQVAENIGEVLWMTDPDKHHMIYVNPAFEKVWGRTCESLYENPRSFLDAIDPNDRERVTAALAKQARDEYDEVYRILRPDGSQRWIRDRAFPVRDESGRVYRIVGIARDITKRKRAEEALRESEERLRSIAANVPGAIFRRVRKADGTVHYPFVSAAYGELFGHDPEGIMADASRLREVVHPEDFERLQVAIERSTERLEGQDNEYRIITPEEQTKWVRAVAQPRRLENGDIVADGIMLDITDRKEAEHKLQQAQKMEAVGQLTGGVAHDFNNLLTIILGNLQLLERQAGDDTRLGKRIEAATHAARRGADLTARLLAFSRRQVLEPKVLDLNGLVSGMDDLLRRTLGEATEIQTVLAEDLWPTEVDPVQMETSLLNLAVNARDAMPDGGKLTIETANATLDEAYAASHPGATVGDYVMLVVSDTGTGMPPEIVEQVFEPFFTTKETGQGTGLGLSMVYGFVKQSGGSVYIYSEEGHGTTIRLYFPRSRSADAATDKETPVGEEISGGSETILVVEDDAGVREVTLAMLEEFGYRVLQAESAAAALTVLDEHPDIDLLFTDVVMPGGVSGPELAKEVLNRRPEIKVLYASGYSQRAFVRDGKLDPGVHLIGKPYQNDDLVREVRRLLDEK